MKRRRQISKIVIIISASWGIWAIVWIASFFRPEIKLDHYSPPYIPAIITILVFLYKKIKNTDFDRKIISPLVKQINELFINFTKKTMHRKCRTYEFIYYLTSGKFDPNIRCEERTPFLKRDVTCRHAACRFGCNKFLVNFFEKRKIPKVLRRCLPWRFIFTTCVHLQTPKLLKGQTYFPGELLHWTVRGISFRMNKEEWLKLTNSYQIPAYNGPFDFTAVIKHLLGDYKINICAKYAREEEGEVFIDGEYKETYNPKEFRSHKNGCVRKPLCALLQDENKQSGQIYTSIPII